MHSPEISIIASLGEGRSLGKGNDLLWRIKDDLKRFKELTMGHPIIMGRKTYESIGKPLPGRTNIVVTRDPAWRVESVTTAPSLEAAITLAKNLDSQEVFIIGGGEIYRQALPYASRLYLTLIEATQDADTYFPEYEDLFTKKISQETRQTPEGLAYTWITLKK